MTIQQLQVETDHVILPHGRDRMVLGGRTSGQAIIVAERDGDVWTISSPWTEDPPQTADTRNDAIDIMEDMALEISPADGYSTFEPDVQTEEGNVPLRELP